MRKLAWPAIANLSNHLLLLCICVLVFQTYVQGHNQHHIIIFFKEAVHRLVRSYGPDKMNRRTDGQMDRQGDSYNLPPPKLCLQGV